MNRILLITLFLFAWSFIQAQENSIASLQKAINHLIETFGDEYPEGAEYLNRLEEINDAESDAYKALQREALLANPNIKKYSWLVEVRDQYWGNHGPINTMFQNGDLHGGGLQKFKTKGGQFDVLSIGEKGVVRIKEAIINAPKGIVRDADISFDGQRILFSMRKEKDDDYHLYEMNVDGTNLKQLTFGRMISDVDPIYLPDGKFLFSSTRDPKFCQCNVHISNNLFTMEVDGANIQQISFNNLADFHSSLMPDGQVLYSRWEYVDRHFGPSLGLWTTNPDGTRHALYMGNNSWSPGFMGDARAIPGTDKVVCTYGACHDLPWGAMVVVDRTKGLDGKEPVVKIWPESAIDLLGDVEPGYDYDMKYRGDVDRMRRVEGRYEDPYPVHDVEDASGGGHFFFVSKGLGEVAPSYSGKNKGRMGIVLADVFGNEVLVYEVSDMERGAYGIIPIAARKKPVPIPSMIDLSKDYGTLYVNDVYLGTGDEMKNVKRGSIKYLRIIDAPAKRSYDTGPKWDTDASQFSPMNWNLTNNKRIIGDVPVEVDGSAFFKVPADMFFQIHALDSNKQLIQAMRSGTVVRPGETQGCIGCHEDRLSTPIPRNAMPLAMRRAPSEIHPWIAGAETIDNKPFNYYTDIQPIFNRHCISCHDYGKKAEFAINLSGDLSWPFNVSYHEIMTRSGRRYTGPEEKLVNFIGDGPPGVLPAYAWGSHRSKLVRILKEGHHEVQLTNDEIQRIATWIDINAVYYGNYQSYHPGRNPLVSLENGNKKLEKLMQYAINDESIGGGKLQSNFRQLIIDKGHILNFERPELSPVLSMIKDEDKRSIVLGYLKEASEELAEHPREDQTNSDEPRSKMDIHNNDRWKLTRTESCTTQDSILHDGKYYPFKDWMKDVYLKE